MYVEPHHNEDLTSQQSTTIKVCASAKSGTMSGAKHIIFDIVGTLVSHEHFYAVIDQRLGPKLQANNISARLLGFA